MNRTLVSLLVCVTLLAGCATRKPPTGEDFYAQGESMFASGNYNEAIQNYQRLIDQYPFSPHAEDAELKIALSYYRMKEYAEAINSLNDFQRMHPTNKSVALAAYYSGAAYFDQIHRADQDQSNTEAALAQFEVVERRFPESPFASLAHDRIEICREMLARNQLFVSNYYYKRANFRAAESRLAELMQKYPDTPVASEALFELGTTLEKEGKKYSAAQAFAAEQRHFPDTPYAKDAGRELAKLKQPIDSEEDPLRLVLAESGFGPAEDHSDNVVVKQRAAMTGSPSQASAPAYGPDGLPVLDRPAPEPRKDTTITQRPTGPVTLRTIRLASSEPPLSVIFDMSGPVKFEKHLDSGPGYSALTVHLDKTKADSKLENHLVFDRSIFKDCDVKADGDGVTVTVNTVPVERFAIIPLEEPPRLLVTFTPRPQDSADTNAAL